MNRSTPLALFLAVVACCVPACKTTTTDRFSRAEDSGPVRVLSLRQLPGLPADVRVAVGKSFQMREPVIFDTDSGVGFFHLEVVAGQRVQSQKVVLEGDFATLSRFVRELDYANEWSGSSLAGQVPKGIWDSVEGTVEGVIEIVKHPLRSAEELGESAWELAKYLAEAVVGDHDPVADITELVRGMVTNACIEIAEERQLHYLQLTTLEARQAVEREAYARLVGQMLVRNDGNRGIPEGDAFTCAEASTTACGPTPPLIAVKGPPLTGFVIKVAKLLPKFAKVKKGAGSAQAIWNLYPKLKTAHQAKAVLAQKVIKSLPALKEFIDRMRKAAIKQAWKEEREMVLRTGKGTRQWSEAEKQLLRKQGKVPGYHGHHINNAFHFPELAGKPDNIKFVTRAEHLAHHAGSLRNMTTGPLMSRGMR